MNKYLKIGLIVFGSLVALFVAAAIILVATVDPNEYKAEIAQAVKENTGRELVFEGDIGFSFFPWLGLEVGPVALGNRPGFSPDAMIRINRAEASVQIMPLFSGKVAIGVIALDGFTANLAVDKQGVNNWDDLTAAGKNADKNGGATAAPEAQPAADGSGQSVKDLSVLGIEITNASLVYDDAMAGKKTALANLDLVVGEVGDKRPFPFELAFDLVMDAPKINTRPRLAGTATYDIDAATLDISGLTLDALGMEITGLFFAKAKDGVSYSGEIDLARTSPRELMKQLGMESPVTADPAVLEALDAAIKFNGTADSASLESLRLKLDDTTVTGTGTVRNFAKPAIEFAINVDDIDADRYMPPASGGQGSEAKAGPAAAGSAEPATEPDLSALRDLDLSGRITVGKAKAMNLRVAEILCQILAKNGVLTVKPFTAKLYDGTLNAVSVLDARSTPAIWREQATVSGVQAGPLLMDLTGKDQVLGAAVVKYDVTGAGLTPEAIKRTLSGTASFAFTDGAVNGINVAKMLRDAFNTIKGRPTSGDEPMRTDFAEMLGSAVITNGHIVNEDLLMKSPLLRVTGKGWADLPRDSVDYLATVTVVGTLKGQDGASIEELSGMPLPIRAKGSLADPSISLDMKALAEALLKDSFKEGTKGIEDTLRKSILGGGKTTEGATDGTATEPEKKKSPGDLLKKLF
ncbi:MAG: AsmA family protein [Pseudodesulfovibrio sp.]|uniref:AsmA family protein n=1 Tax=Pseudodesulfovibrio aespoeensis (strain ATCC 700646 / DSM 10631 / Aspo-2) TaxID=643562 RepID=E6VZI4_PSEA9|nr:MULTISPECIES: AsmA family protein [Pseudodesulfovibrio]MBU4191937.1 AsmA family protein [Pseudomonadota bacterium]ADU61698.1 AsmA family protein [Pseudodesulfovibrio aespoeensis Aspo-2]MBU4244263.1 AsmA family protein [Pseudomonadota bacterium]MBU4379444.1 AsmA family protein [Pseudomonadota bacterium]MBU4474894.1 AsmA family protein [Pseudomonadota bacterium]